MLNQMDIHASTHIKMSSLIYFAIVGNLCVLGGEEQWNLQFIKSEIFYYINCESFLLLK